MASASANLLPRLLLILLLVGIATAAAVSSDEENLRSHPHRRRHPRLRRGPCPLIQFLLVLLPLPHHNLLSLHAIAGVNCSHCRLQPVAGTGPPSSPPAAGPIRPRPPFNFFPLPPPPPAASIGAPTTECVTVLAGLMSCGTFLTGTDPETPTPQSECCAGLQGFISSAGAGGDSTLRCLCPVILGDVNKMLPKPVDPVRMMYLPIACGVVLPPHLLPICFTGQQTPPLAVDGRTFLTSGRGPFQVPAYHLEPSFQAERNGTERRP